MARSSDWARLEVAVRREHADPAGTAALRELGLVGLETAGVRVHRVFFIEGLADTAGALGAIFADPVIETGRVGEPIEGRGVAVSVWKKPGVMDPAEASILRALRTRDTASAAP